MEPIVQSMPKLPGESLRESYKRILGGIAESKQAKAGAYEDLGAEEWQRRHPGSTIEQARAAYRNRPGTPGNPVKAPDSNSAAIKFGKRGGGYPVG
jgi:hypothetical protein